MLQREKVDLRHFVTTAHLRRGYMLGNLAQHRFIFPGNSANK